MGMLSNLEARFALEQGSFMVSRVRAKPEFPKAEDRKKSETRNPNRRWDYSGVGQTFGLLSCFLAYLGTARHSSAEIPVLVGFSGLDSRELCEVGVRPPIHSRSGSGMSPGS